MANQQESSSTENVGKPSVAIARGARDEMQNGKRAGKEAVETAAAATREATGRISQRVQDATKDMSEATGTLRDTSGYAADRMNALLSSYAVLANGAQEFQQKMFEIWQNSWDMAANTPGELLQCRSLTDFAELQRDMLRKGIDSWLDVNSKFLRLSGNLAERAVEPIEERLGH